MSFFTLKAVEAHCHSWPTPSMQPAVLVESVRVAFFASGTVAGVGEEGRVIWPLSHGEQGLPLLLMGKFPLDEADACIVWVPRVLHRW